MSDTNWIQRIKATSAAEFLTLIGTPEQLSRGESLWRGEGGHKRPLVASAVRCGGRDRLLQLSRAIGVPNYLSAEVGPAFAEVAVVADFYARANKQGLPLPILSNEHHQMFVNGTRGLLNDSLGDVKGLLENWPSRELWGLCALAQHYGVPTRLLDWTSNPLIAAYFAAHSSIARSQKLRSNATKELPLEVWWTSTEVCIHLSSLRPARSEATTESGPGHGAQLYLVDAPYPGNPNLAAQVGRFTLLSAKPTSTQLQLDSTLEEVIAATTALGVPMLPSFRPLLKCFKLEVEHAFELLKLLGDAGYDASRIYPGFEGCARASQERALISRGPMAN